MKLSITLLFISLLLYSSGVACQVATSLTSDTICKTLYDSTSVESLATTQRTYSRSTTLTITGTSTPVVTSTPPPVTETITTGSLEVVTTTIGSAVTSTITTTTTSTSFVTATAPAPPPVTLTVLTTQIISAVSTVTFTTVSFPPIQSTFPGATRKRSRSRNSRPRPRQQTSPNPATSLSRGPTGQYPKAVYCTVIVKKVVTVVKVIFAPAKTITAIPPTVTKTITTPITTTSTIYPPNTLQTITSTETATSTTTITPEPSTATTTSTITSTTVTAIETIYPQCDYPNRATRAQYGWPIYGLQRQVPVTVDNNATNAQKCCIDCLLDPLCAVSFFFGGEIVCWLVGPAPDSGKTCDPDNPFTFYLDAAETIQTQTFAANNKCGRFIPWPQ